MPPVTDGTARRPSLRILLRGTGPLLAALGLASAALAEPGSLPYRIDAQPLPDALDRFSEQSGLQVVYDYATVADVASPGTTGARGPDAALDTLLAGTGIRWRRIDGRTIALLVPEGTTPRTRDADTSPAGHAGPIPAVTGVTVEAPRILPEDSRTAASGFTRPLIETPRSVSVISRDVIDLHGLSAVEDLIRVVPGTFTTARFGIQGSVDVRSIPADTFLRGMKRVNFQGHGRSVLAAMDTIEVVRGPPSPLYGMSKIGGYTNVVPRSGRAAGGSGSAQAEGFAQLTLGSYRRSEMAGGFGAPFSLGERQGGYYLYGLLEQADSYARNVPVSQKVGQAAFTIDDFAGPFRLEAGFNYQRSDTAGALTNRVTRALIDSGRYVRGSPLVPLDRNGNGKIGYLEMHRGSPVAGLLGPANQPLVQHFAWPLDEGGRPLPLERFPVVAGIPQSMHEYLTAHPEADPTGLLRARGPGGPLPVSGHVPVGMVLDPRTTGYDTLDPRRADSFEREIAAEFAAAYFDLVHDSDPRFSIRNQFFVDSMDQSKWSEQPGGGKQDVYAWEDKFTVTRRLAGLPAWLRIDALGSANVRHTRATGRRYGGDFGNHRTDVMLGDGRMRPDATFVHPFENADLARDGAPWTSHYETRYREAGIGVLLDIDILAATNLVVGGRLDHSSARNTDFAAFHALKGTSAAPGIAAVADATASASDRAASWSASLTLRLPLGIRPYVTLATSSATLEGSNHKMDNDVIARGHIGRSRLREAGVKASLLDDRLLVTAAVFEQARTDVDEGDIQDVLSADVTATRTRGWEGEIKWTPAAGTLLSFHALHQETVFHPNAGAAIMVDARALGFQDVVDAQGNVIYPAEAFLYGGRAFLLLPAGLPEYERKQGNPPLQLGFSLHRQWPGGLGFTLGGNHFSRTYSGRLKLVELPAATVVNAGVFLEFDGWRFKVDVQNLASERWFRARTGDTLGETLVQAMPGRRWQLTVNRTF